MNYTDVDAKIVELVRVGRKTFTEIWAAFDVGVGNFRLIDRRLQVLRKRGVLTYTRKTGWSCK